MIAICPRCRIKRAYFTDLRGDCNGLGTIECLCGGDQCVCHNHGSVECQGCPECDPTAVIEDNGWPHPPDEATTAKGR